MGTPVRGKRSSPGWRSRQDETRDHRKPRNFTVILTHARMRTCPRVDAAPSEAQARRGTDNLAITAPAPISPPFSRIPHVLQEARFASSGGRRRCGWKPLATAGYRVGASRYDPPVSVSPLGQPRRRGSAAGRARAARAADARRDVAHRAAAAAEVRAAERDLERADVVAVGLQALGSVSELAPRVSSAPS